MKLTVACWKWGSVFSALYVNRLRVALERHLHLDHELVCVTDDPTGIDPRVRIVALPDTFAHTPRCRRRMQVFSREFAQQLGARILTIDLDVVLVDDITPIVDRTEPMVFWRVGHAQVFSGSFHMMDAGYLDKLWLTFAADPEGFPARIQRNGRASDQAMLNFYLSAHHIRAPFWTERDGFVTYYGEGYERHAHLGVSPAHPALPACARIVVLGSADKAVMDEGRYDWIREHWSSLPA